PHDRRGGAAPARGAHRRGDRHRREGLRSRRRGRLHGRAQRRAGPRGRPPRPRRRGGTGETIRPIRIVGDPVLRTPCDPIRTITEGTRTLVRDLKDTVDDEGRAGVAANQIGVNLRAFSWHFVETGEIGCILNPVIVELSEELQHDDEGCLSVPGLFYPRTRSAYAR